MSSKGIVRKMDELGRVVIPIELRRILSLANKDDIQISREGDSIVIKKYEPTCVLCGEFKNNTQFKGKNLCPSCIQYIKKSME